MAAVRWRSAISLSNLIGSCPDTHFQRIARFLKLLIPGFKSHQHVIENLSQAAQVLRLPDPAHATRIFSVRHFSRHACQLLNRPSQRTSQEEGQQVDDQKRQRERGNSQQERIPSRLLKVPK